MRILVCDHVDAEGLDLLKSNGFQVDDEAGITREKLIQKIPDYEIVIVRGRTKIEAGIVNVARKLKIIGRAGVGLDNIDLKAAKDAGIKVLNTPAAPTISVAELTVGLMLSLLRKISFADREMKEGRWIKNELIGRELQGKKIGIIGLAGRIGGQVARILTVGFEADVWGYDVIRPRGIAGLTYELAGSLEELLRESDIVSIHVPYAPQTHHLLDSRKLGMMKKGAYIVNTSRGDIVDGPALFELLKSRHLSGAGLDVFHSEPPVDDWERNLINLPKGVTVATCHIGAQTVEAQKKESIELAQKIISEAKTDGAKVNRTASAG